MYTLDPGKPLRGCWCHCSCCCAHVPVRLQARLRDDIINDLVQWEAPGTEATVSHVTGAGLHPARVRAQRAGAFLAGPRGMAVHGVHISMHWYLCGLLGQALLMQASPICCDKGHSFWD